MSVSFPKYLTPSEVAAILRVSVGTLRFGAARSAIRFPTPSWATPFGTKRPKWKSSS